MDRQVIYAGAIPLDTDQLLQNRSTMTGLGFALQATLGTTTIADGLPCTPTSPATMTVNVGAGSIYSLQNVDNSAYGSLTADTTDQIVKQGIIQGVTNFACPAPGTSGFSVAYLVQATYQDVDGGSTVLPYYNASNPAVAYNGPNNTGVSQNTVRKGVCVLTLKAGTAATTGTQVIPAADVGAIPLWAVTVSNGQTTITSGSILQLTGSFVGTKLPNVVAAIQSGASTYAVDISGSGSTITVNLTPLLTAYAAGQVFRVKIANNNLGNPVFNAGPGNKAIVDGAGNPIIGSRLRANGVYTFAYDGTNMVLQSVPGEMVTGGFKNLKITTTSNTAATITADELVFGDGNGNVARLLGVNVSYGTGGSGANGLDTGSLATSTGYYEWVIYNPSTSTVASLLSLSSTAPTLPSGYTFKARVGWSFVDGSSHLRFKIQYGRDAQYVVGTNPTQALVMASGSSGSVTTPTYTAVSVSTFVPATASAIKVALAVSGAIAIHAIAAPNGSYGTVSSAAFIAATGPAVAGFGEFIYGAMLLESSSIYYASDGTAAALQCFGWTDNL
jgi:hypothetical protein